ncbi:xanthine dehydrogenase family protein molybdopterin-binding subunit [Litoribrevibacter albus]|uniref:Oxidoreductase n=1 Tax=Litoribrevibacter albus TaxID=1473156 RepID=A0AA37W797_9GAMM|nr:xanthine dehydrogenase family protein molybdopterin-binding subunit [Litoribrevibacter albus]GLQ32305.1 oxidoreductase [Litoribrevibacter albus]
MSLNVSRRSFIVGSAQAGAGLVLGVSLAGCATDEGMSSDTSMPKKGLEANAFVSVATDGTVTVQIKHLEMGQGTYTGLATLVAEELDADWGQVRAVNSEANPEKYNNLFWGKFQGTGGSTAIANSFMQLREAGAAAKAMLVAAAASSWGVPASELTTDKGQVFHSASGRQIGYGQLAELAALQKVPEKITLKEPSQFKLIGQKLPRKDSGKTNGTAVFTQDIQLPGQLTALVAHPPRFGAKLKSFDATNARQVPGVVDVVQISNGVAVLANDYWQAKTGRDLLQIQWDDSKAMTKGSDQLMAEYKDLAKKPGLVAVKTGDVDSAFAQADKVIEAEFEFPYLAHSPMEAMNCVVQTKQVGGAYQSAELWYGAQLHTGDQMSVAKLLGIEPAKVAINTIFAGGSFGRRANPASDYVLEAAEIAKAYGKDVPVKLVWSREDDTRAGYYRPMYFHKLKAGLDSKGTLVAWQHRIVGQSIIEGTLFEGFLVKDGIDHTSVEGASNLPYAIPNLQVELHTTKVEVPVLWWRSVGSTHTAYATECFLDEVARAAGKDPVELRMALLTDQPRHRGVLALAVEQSGMKGNSDKNKAYGVAVHKSFDTYVAQVVELSKSSSGFKLEKVTCAVDCGVPVNPDVIKAQMEGGIGFGLSPALYSEIHIDNGAVRESNFHDYQVIRMRDMPKVDVHVVPSTEPPTGVGEPGTPVIGPAVANALAAAGGPVERRLPMKTPLS